MDVFLGLTGLVTLLYFITVLAIILIVVVSLWRSMKAQEAIARSLERIEQIIAQDRK